MTQGAQESRQVRKRRWLGGIVAGTLVVAMILGLGFWRYTNDRWPFSPSGGSYRELGDTPVAVNDGALKSITAVIDTDKKPQFKEVQPLAEVTHVTPDGEVGAEITLRFTLDRAVEDPQDVLIATSKTGEANSWELVAPTEVSDDGRYAYVKTTHLSWWQPLWRSVKELVNAAMTELKKSFDALTGDVTAEAEKPKCKDEQKARDKGYSVNSAGDSLYWCLGLEGDKPIMRIVNKRRYPLLVGYPDFTPKYVPHADFGAQSLAQKLSGNGKLTLFPFDEVHFTAAAATKDGEQAAIGAEYNGNAQSLYQLETGVVLALNILDRFGAGGGVVSNGKISKSAFDKVAQVMGKFALVKECGNELFKLEEFNPGSLMSKCFDVDTIMTVFGWKGVLLAPAMVAGPVINFFRSEFNAIGDLLNGRDRYALRLNYKKPVNPMEKFVGEWHVHGATVVYKTDMTGTETWNWGPCNLDTGDHMCTAYATLALALNDDGTLFVEVIDLSITDETGQPPFDTGLMEFGLGSTYTVSYKEPGLLERYGEGLGNPYLCKDVANTACGG